MGDDLTKKKEEWLERLKRGEKTFDPKEGHRMAWRTMQNRTRREILAFVIGGRSFYEIKEHFNLDDSALKLHLDMLERALYVERLVEGNMYYPTPLGEEYIMNVKEVKVHE
jgi:DNA-binding transcriptional ArsR family regulator